jgi:hypothetical protein
MQYRVVYTSESGYPSLFELSMFRQKDLKNMPYIHAVIIAVKYLGGTYLIP